MTWGLYCHIPFCRSRCPYCGFASTVATGTTSFSTYLDALITEYHARDRSVFDSRPATAYIGGGTPSLLPAEQLSRFIGIVTSPETVECTVEANPDSLCETPGRGEDWLATVRDAGAGRVSIGIQSFDDTVLAALGRLHDASEAERSIHMARRAGFDAVSADLMFGVPGQTLDSWKETLDRCVSLGPDHISAYSLGIEEDTPFFRLAASNGLDLPGEDETADMYETAVSILIENGYGRYEISNYARSGFECRHNMSYWDFTPYLGIGAAAHGFDGAMRFWNVDDPATYISAVGAGGDARACREMLTDEDFAGEYLMLSLRTRRGLDLNRLCELGGEPSPAFFGTAEHFLEEKLLDRNGGGILVLTSAGTLLADEIIAELAHHIEARPDPERLRKTDIS